MTVPRIYAPTNDSKTEMFSSEMNKYARKIVQVENAIAQFKAGKSKANPKKGAIPDARRRNIRQAKALTAAHIRYMNSAISFIQAHMNNFDMLPISDSERATREARARNTIGSMVLERNIWLHKEEALSGG